MTEPGELRCQSCGESRFSHFQDHGVQDLGQDGEARWWNKCEHCGSVSEYMPTLSEIRQECLKIRSEERRFEVSDQQEKSWLASASQHQADQEDDFWDLPESAA